MHGPAAQHFNERRQVENVLGDAIERAGRPGTVAVSAQVHGVHVKMLPQRARHPVPVARMVQAAMHQQKRRQAISVRGAIPPPVPELQLQAIGIVIVGYGFQPNYCTGRLLLAVKALLAHFGVVPDVDSLHQEQNVLRDVGGVIGDALQVVCDEHQIHGARNGGALFLHKRH
jgi:hypothetical protein